MTDNMPCALQQGKTTEGSYRKKSCVSGVPQHLHATELAGKHDSMVAREIAITRQQTL